MAFQPARPQNQDFGGSFQQGMASAISAVQGNKDRAQKERQANRTYQLALKANAMAEERLDWERKEQIREEGARKSAEYINNLEVRTGQQSDQTAFVFDTDSQEMNFNSGLFDSMKFSPKNKNRMQMDYVKNSGTGSMYLDTFNQWFDGKAATERKRIAAKIINGISMNFSEGQKNEYSRMLITNPQFKEFMTSINGTEEFNQISEKLNWGANTPWTWKDKVIDPLGFSDESTFLGAHAEELGLTAGAAGLYGAYKWFSGAEDRAAKAAAEAAKLTEEAAQVTGQGKYTTVEAAQAEVDKLKARETNIRKMKKADGTPYKSISARDAALKKTRDKRKAAEEIVDNWSDDISEASSKAGKKPSSALSPKWKNIKSGRFGRGVLPTAVGYTLGEKLMPGESPVADTIGGLAGSVTMHQVYKKITSPEGLKTLKEALKKSSAGKKILAKLAVSMAGYLGPQAAEPVSTALGVAGTAWAAYDIAKLASSVPEIMEWILSD